MVTTKDIKRTAVNYVVARKKMGFDRMFKYIVVVNDAVLTFSRSWQEANDVAYGACLMLRSLGYETRITFVDGEEG